MKAFQALTISLVLLSLPACAGVDLTGDQDQALADDAGGELSFEWQILDQGELVSCVDAGASEVEIAILGDEERRERTSCFGGFAVIGELASGQHLVEISLVAPNGERLVTAEVGEVDIVEGATIPLGAVELPL